MNPAPPVLAPVHGWTRPRSLLRSCTTGCPRVTAFPYVDKDVVAASLAIKGNQKIEGHVSKAILKKAAKAWLPREIIYRPKGVFSAPLRAWIRRDLRDMVEDQLMRGKLVGSGFLNGKYIRRMVDDDRNGEADMSKEIWQLLTLETWMQHHSHSI